MKCMGYFLSLAERKFSLTDLGIFSILPAPGSAF